MMDVVAPWVVALTIIAALILVIVIGFLVYRRLYDGHDDRIGEHLPVKHHVPPPFIRAQRPEYGHDRSGATEGYTPKKYKVCHISHCLSIATM